MENQQIQILVTNKADMAAQSHAITSAAFGLLLQISAIFWPNLVKLLCTHPVTIEQTEH